MLLRLFLLLASFFHACVAVDLNAIKNLRDQLPSMVAYWPLSKDFRANDAFDNRIHGLASAASSLTYAFGPYSHNDKCLNTKNSYIIWQSDLLEFKYSWTLTVFVQSMLTTAMPLYEYQGPTIAGDWPSHVWQYTTSPTLYVNSKVTAESLMATCNFKGSWKFIAAVYDNTTQDISLYCSNTFVGYGNVTVDPYTTNTLYLGHRDPTTNADARFACASVYSSALTGAELQKVKNLCPLLSSIYCSDNCQPGTCYVDVDLPLGYNCTCIYGYEGDDCSIRKFNFKI